MNQILEVIPDEANLSKPLFDSDVDYESFRADYSAKILPELEILREARRRSEEECRKHWMC